MSSGLERSLRDADVAGFESFYRESYAGLVKFATTFVRDSAVAQDVVQESFARLWQRRSSIGPAESMRAYLYKSVRNRALNAVRDQNLRSVRQSEYAVDVEQSVAASDEVDAKHLNVKLQAWIEMLPNRQREALLLSRFEGLSHAEIADVMGVSPRTVNNHLVGALKFIRSKIAAFEPRHLAV